MNGPAFVASSGKRPRWQHGANDGVSVESRAAEVVAGAFNDNKPRRRRDRLDGALKLRDRAERIGGSVKEEARGFQPREMLHAQLLGLAWRMQRIGEEQEARGQLWLLRRENRRLPAAIGVASQENVAMREVPQHRRRRFQSGAV